MESGKPALHNTLLHWVRVRGAHRTMNRANQMGSHITQQAVLHCQPMRVPLSAKPAASLGCLCMKEELLQQPLDGMTSECMASQSGATLGGSSIEARVHTHDACQNTSGSQLDKVSHSTANRARDFMLCPILAFRRAAMRSPSLRSRPCSFLSRVLRCAMRRSAAMLICSVGAAICSAATPICSAMSTSYAHS